MTIQINYNVFGTPTDIPTLQIDSDAAVYAGELLQFGEVRRCQFTMPDTVLRHGFWVRGNFPHFRGIIPPHPGGYEGDQPPVQPPEDPPAKIVYQAVPVNSPITIHDINFVRNGTRWLSKMQDGFPWFYKFSKGEDILPLIQEAKSWPGGGANGARVFFAKASGPNFGFWADLHPIRADYPWAAIEPFLKLMAQHDLVIEITNGDLQVTCPSVSQQAAYFERLWDVASRYVVLGEYCNEYKKNGLKTEVVRKRPGILLCGGSSLSDGECYTPALDWSAHHARRSGFPEKALDAANVTHHYAGWDGAYPGTGRQPIVINETTGAGEVNVGDSRTTNAEFFFQLGRMLAAFNGGTFHSEAGLQGHLHGPNQRRCGEAFFRGVSLIEG